MCGRGRRVIPARVTPALGPRLHALAELVTPGLPALDVGTDHALLPCALVASGRVPAAIASDLRSRPLAAAAATIARLGLAAKISLRRADGLSAITPGEVATVIVAGMGPDRIAALLAADPPRLRGVRRLVLGPHGDPGLLRRWLAARRYTLVDERIAAERGRFYVALAAEPRAGPPLGDLELEVGPHLLTRVGPTFLAYVRRELRLLDAEIDALQRSDPGSPRLNARLARRDLWFAALARTGAPR